MPIRIDGRFDVATRPRIRLKQSRLGALWNRQADATLEPDVILDVDGTDGDGDQPGDRRHYCQMTDDEKHIEPSRHEQEVEQSGKQDEGAADDRHVAALAHMDHQAQQEQEDEKRTGIKGIEPAEQDGHDRQGQGSRIDFSDQRGRDRLLGRRIRWLPGRIGRGTRIRLQLGITCLQRVPEVRAGGLIIAIAVVRLSAIEERRHVGRLDIERLGEGLIGSHRRRIGQLEMMDVEPGQLLGQFIQDSKRPMAMGTGHRPEQIEVHAQSALVVHLIPGRAIRLLGLRSCVRRRPKNQRSVPERRRPKSQVRHARNNRGRCLGRTRLIHAGLVDGT